MIEKNPFLRTTVTNRNSTNALARACSSRKHIRVRQQNRATRLKVIVLSLVLSLSASVNTSIQRTVCLVRRLRILRLQPRQRRFGRRPWAGDANSHARRLYAANCSGYLDSSTIAAIRLPLRAKIIYIRKYK